MEFVVDLGNTTCRVFIVKNGKIIAEGSIPTTGPSFKNYLEHWFTKARQWGVAGITVVSVVPSMEDCISRLAGSEHMPLSWVKPDLENGTVSDAPAGLGPDRFADLVGAVAIVGRPCIVADLGTALTVDAVDGQGRYQGGVIFPGPEVVSANLASQTACLSDLGWSGLSQPQGIPRETESGLEAGLVWGYQDLISGFVGRLQAELGGEEAQPAILTGGGARSMTNLPKGVPYFDPHLTAKGAAVIGLYNRGVLDTRIGLS